MLVVACGPKREATAWGGADPGDGGALDATAADAGLSLPSFDASFAQRDGGRDGSTAQRCAGGAHTTISGTVYAPNGTLPLYDVIVFAPAEKLPALPAGATCEPCGALNSVKAYATALSDAHGHFVLVDPPAGKNVPLAIQVGKWRRQVVLPEVVPCADNPLTDPDLTRLPRNTTEGSLPKIGVTTGGADSIACMLPKLGIDPAEFGVSGTTAVTLYAGGGGGGPAGIQPAQALWNDANAMKKYDLLIFSCEGTEAVGTSGPGFFGATKDATSFAAMTQYLDAGGRIFGTDFQYTVWKDSPDTNLSGAATIPGGAPPGGGVVALDTSFPKGKALADWVSALDPSQPYGKVTFDVVFDNVAAAKSPPVQVWGRGDDATAHPRLLTINTPVGQPADKQCGKAVHIDAHVNQQDFVDATYPAGCKSSLATAEKAFAFFFFDLAACIQKEDLAPQAPPPNTSPPQ